MSRSLTVETINPNVPAGAFVLYESTYMSGEITTTYYADAEGGMWVVGDWSTDTPAPCTMHDVCRASGLWESIIEATRQSWADKQKGGGA